MPNLDLDDIQGNILRGYRLPFAAHAFLEIHEVAEARSFLRGLAVTTERGPGTRLESALNVAFTRSGLARLRGILPELRPRFRAFSEGMRARAGLLGDRPEDFPPFWDRTHVWLSIYARSAERVDERWRELQGRLRGLETVGLERAAAIVESQGGRDVWLEHFGFRDDISNPEVEGAEELDKLGPGTGRVGPHGQWLPIRTGEFLHGYDNEAGDPILTGELGALLKNGTFVVVRKLEQRVNEFREYLAKVSRHFAMDADELAAKIVGRRRDGAPLVEADPDPTWNKFDYSRDANGSRCPLGAHVRRVHPRDVDNRAGTSGKRRLIRRGMPYGSPPAEGSTATRRASPAHECGLFFIAMNASIEDQFEFIQRDWINHASRSALGDDWDPLVGAHPAEGGQLVIPRQERPLLLLDVPRFVHTRGGQYFFMPGLTALRSLCDEAPRAQLER